MSTYYERKAERTEEFNRNHGLKMVTCGACSGSGRYDHNGSPPCDSCGGLGKVRESAPPEPKAPTHWREELKSRQHLLDCRRRLKAS